MEREKFNRVVPREPTAGVCEQSHKCSGPAVDVIRFGSSLVGIPKKIQCNEPELSILVSGHGENLRIYIRPKWSMLGG